VIWLNQLSNCGNRRLDLRFSIFDVIPKLSTRVACMFRSSRTALRIAIFGSTARQMSEFVHCPSNALRKGFFIAGLSGFAVAQPIQALAASPAASFTAPVGSLAPIVTGLQSDVSDPSWAGSSTASDFTNLSTRTADVSTTVQYIFSPTSFVVAFSVKQRSITARQNANNVGLGLDDYVALSLDTSVNGTGIYNFEVSPHAVRYQSSSESSRYNPVYLAKASIVPGGWFAELVIPYNVLKTSQRGQATWRINFSRFEVETQQTITWAYAPTMISTADPTLWPKIASVPAFAGGKGTSNAELYGLFNGGIDRSISVTPSGTLVSQQTRNFGADINIPVTAGLNAVGTLNPDFSNVEADQQIIAPQEFRRMYSEYRPFFTQGANFLPSPEVFYTPSIGQFFRGAKLEGLEGPFGIGLLNDGGDGRSDTAYQLSYTSLDQQISASVAGAQVNVAGLHDLTNEISAAYQNLTSRVSFGTGFSHEAGSTTRGADRAFVYAGQQRANYQLFGAYYDIAPEYSPFDGFVPQNDIRGPQLSAQINSTESVKGWIKNSSAAFYFDRYVDRSGSVRQADDTVSLNLTFRNLLGISLYVGNSFLRNYQSNFPNYSSGTTTAFDTRSLTMNYRANTASATSLTVSSGAFGNSYLHQVLFSTSKPVTKRLSASFDYDMNVEDSFVGAKDGQTLKRLALVNNFNGDENLALNYRVISGTGGFSLPGKNLAVSYRHRFVNGSNLYFEFGSPASVGTLNRFILKFVRFIGNGVGE